MQAFEEGFTVDQLFELTNIDRWWLAQLAELHEVEQWLVGQKLESISADDMTELKKKGFSDQQMARLLGGARGYGLLILWWC